MFLREIDRGALFRLPVEVGDSSLFQIDRFDPDGKIRVHVVQGGFKFFTEESCFPWDLRVYQVPEKHRQMSFHFVPTETG